MVRPWPIYIAYHGTNKRVELEVAPELTTKAGGIAFTPYRFKETWFIDQGGSVTIEKSEPVAGAAKLILTL